MVRNICKIAVVLGIASAPLSAQRTTYFKFCVNGVEDTVMTQGVGAMAWECDCEPGDTMSAELRLDLNKNHIIDSGDKLWPMGAFGMIDGNTSWDNGPADSSAIQDGIFYCTLPPFFALAPTYYVMKVTNTNDLSTAEDFIHIKSNPSPAVTVSGIVSIEGVIPPNPLLYAIWVGTNMDKDPAFWGAITDSSGHYTLNLPNTGTWHIAPMDNIPPYLSPTELTINILGDTTGIDFEYTQPEAFVYGDIKDDRDSLVLREFHIYLRQGNENVGGTVTNNGHYIIGAPTGSDFYFDMWPNEVFPDYLMPTFWNQHFSISGDSLRKDIVLTRADTSIFGIVTENGGLPSQAYSMEASNDDIGWMRVSSNPTTGLFEIPVSSIVSSYYVQLNVWDTELPEGFGFEDGNGWNVSFGDTVRVKLVSYKGSVSGAFTVDAGDSIPDFTYFTVAVVDSYWQTKGQSQVNSDGTFKVYAPEGTWNLVLWGSTDMWLSKPFVIEVTVDTVDVPGNDFFLNYAHCEVSGVLYGTIPDSVFENGVGFYAYAGTGWLDDYATGKTVFFNKAYSLNLCEASWHLQPPDIPGYYPLPETTFTITESDNSITIDFYYTKIGAEEQNRKPLITSLNSIVPNPFTNGAVINYSCASAGKVSLKIYDLSGREVRTLVDETKKTGYYTANWNGKDNADKNLPAGVYFCKFSAGNINTARKLILVK